MANKVTQEDIKAFNEKYYVCHNYSQVARETGFSAGTVKKYIIPDWKPIDENTIQKFNQPLPEFDMSIFRLKNWGSLCELSDIEKAEIKQLQEEISI